MKKGYLPACLIFIILQGCATYHKLPIDHPEIEKQLRPPDMNSIRIPAGSIGHAILKTVKFDYKNGLSPDEAAILAVVANPKLRAIRDEKGLAEAQLLSAGILPNPQISYNLDVPTWGSTKGTIKAYGLGLGWDISSLIARSAKLNAAKNHAASIDLNVAWQEWQVAQAARLHVFRLLFIKKQLDVAEKAKQNLSNSLQTVKKGFSMRAKTILELEAAKMACQNAQDILLALLREQQRERLALNRCLGFPPGYDVLLQNNIELPSCKNVFKYQKIIKGIDDRRLDLLALKKGYESSEAEVRAAILSQFPGINIGVNQARDTGNVGTTGFTISLNLPFFDRNQGRIALKRATRKQLKDEYTARIFEARSNVATILSDMNSQVKEIESARKSLKISTGLVNAYKKALNGGNGDIITYNNLKNDMESQKLMVLKLRKDFTGLRIALEITAGEYSGRTDTSEKGRSYD